MADQLLTTREAAQQLNRNPSEALALLRAHSAKGKRASGWLWDCRDVARIIKLLSKSAPREEGELHFDKSLSLQNAFRAANDPKAEQYQGARRRYVDRAIVPPGPQTKEG
jgi:hypothetical protein